MIGTLIIRVMLFCWCIEMEVSKHIPVQGYSQLTQFLYFHLPIRFILVALRPDSRSWRLLKGLRRNTRLTSHTRQDASGRVISRTRRILPENTQHSRGTNTHDPSRIRTHKPSNRAATRIGTCQYALPNI